MTVAPAFSAEHRYVLGMRVDATNYEAAVEQVVTWGEEGNGGYVCIATVNNVIEAYDDRTYRSIINSAHLVTPDGMPLVWALRLFGVRDATRVYGPDLTPLVCRRAAELGIPVGFYGASPVVLRDLVDNVRTRFPALRVAYACSPPFRALTVEEDDADVEAIQRSGARILFVGLGAPKQEQWMAAHRDRLPAVLLGVGAAFDFIAGHKRQAHPALQRAGLEWLFRLATEPTRLWRRYAERNPRFVLLFLLQLLVGDRRGRENPDV